MSQDGPTYNKDKFVSREDEELFEEFKVMLGNISMFSDEGSTLKENAEHWLQYLAEFENDEQWSHGDWLPEAEGQGWTMDLIADDIVSANEQFLLDEPEQLRELGRKVRAIHAEKLASLASQTQREITDTEVDDLFEYSDPFDDPTSDVRTKSSATPYGSIAGLAKGQGKEPEQNQEQDLDSFDALDADVAEMLRVASEPLTPATEESTPAATSSTNPTTEEPSPPAASSTTSPTAPKPVAPPTDDAKKRDSAALADKENTPANQQQPQKRRKTILRAAFKGLLGGQRAAKKEQHRARANAKSAQDMASIPTPSPNVKTIGERNELLIPETESIERRAIAQVLSGWRLPSKGSDQVILTQANVRHIAAEMANHYSLHPQKKKEGMPREHKNEPHLFIVNLTAVLNGVKKDDKKTALENAQILLEQFLLTNAHNPQLTNLVKYLKNPEDPSIAEALSPPEDPSIKAYKDLKDIAFTISGNSLIKIENQLHKVAKKILIEQTLRAEKLAMQDKAPQSSAIAMYQMVTQAVEGSPKDRREFIGQFVQDLRNFNSQLLLNIPLSEFQNLAWAKDNKNELAPNLLAYSKAFNDLSSMVTEDILSAKNQKHQEQIYAFYIDVAFHCLETGDFNSVTAISASFGTAAIGRLLLDNNGEPRPLQQSLSKKHQKRLAKIKEVTSRAEAYKAPRVAIAQAKEKGINVIPYLGILQSDLTFSIEGNPDQLKHTSGQELQNTNRGALVGAILTDVAQQQAALVQESTKPSVTPVGSIITQAHMTDDAHYKRSLAVYPRGEDVIPFADIDEASGLSFLGDELEKARIAASPAAPTDSASSTRDPADSNELSSSGSSVDSTVDPAASPTASSDSLTASSDEGLTASSDIEPVVELTKKERLRQKVLIEIKATEKTFIDNMVKLGSITSEQIEAAYAAINIDTKDKKNYASQDYVNNLIQAAKELGEAHKHVLEAMEDLETDPEKALPLIEKAFKGCVQAHKNYSSIRDESAIVPPTVDVLLDVQLRFQSFDILPAQRVAKYPLLARDLLENSEADTPLFEAAQYFLANSSKILVQNLQSIETDRDITNYQEKFNRFLASSKKKTSELEPLIRVYIASKNKVENNQPLSKYDHAIIDLFEKNNTMLAYLSRLDKSRGLKSSRLLKLKAAIAGEREGPLVDQQLQRLDKLVALAKEKISPKDPTLGSFQDFEELDYVADADEVRDTTTDTLAEAEEHDYVADAEQVRDTTTDSMTVALAEVEELDYDSNDADAQPSPEVSNDQYTFDKFLKLADMLNQSMSPSSAFNAWAIDQNSAELRNFSKALLDILPARDLVPFQNAIRNMQAGQFKDIERFFSENPEIEKLYIDNFKLLNDTNTAFQAHMAPQNAPRSSPVEEPQGVVTEAHTIDATHEVDATPNLQAKHERLPPKEMADQLQLLALDTLSRANPSDLQSKNQGEFANYIDDWNKILGMVLRETLAQDNKEDLQDQYTYFVQLMGECLENRDYQSASAIYLALSKTDIERLCAHKIETKKQSSLKDNKGFLTLSDEDKKTLLKAATLFDPRSNFLVLGKQQVEDLKNGHDFIPYAPRALAMLDKALEATGQLQENAIAESLEPFVVMTARARAIAKEKAPTFNVLMKSGAQEERTLPLSHLIESSASIALNHGYNRSANYNYSRSLQILPRGATEPFESLPENYTDIIIEELIAHVSEPNPEIPLTKKEAIRYLREMAETHELAKQFSAANTVQFSDTSATQDGHGRSFEDMEADAVANRQALAAEQPLEAPQATPQLDAQALLENPDMQTVFIVLSPLDKSNPTEEKKRQYVMDALAGSKLDSKCEANSKNTQAMNYYSDYEEAYIDCESIVESGIGTSKSMKGRPKDFVIVAVTVPKAILTPEQGDQEQINSQEQSHGIIEQALSKQVATQPGLVTIRAIETFESIQGRLEGKTEKQKDEFYQAQNSMASLSATTRIDISGGLTQATKTRGLSFIKAAQLMLQHGGADQTPISSPAIVAIKRAWEQDAGQLEGKDLLALEATLITELNKRLYASVKTEKEVKEELENAENHLNWKPRAPLETSFENQGLTTTRTETPMTLFKPDQEEQWLSILDKDKAPEWFKDLVEWEQAYLKQKVESWVALNDPKPNMGQYFGSLPSTIRRYPGSANGYATTVTFTQEGKPDQTFTKLRSGIIIPEKIKDRKEKTQATKNNLEQFIAQAILNQIAKRDPSDKSDLDFPLLLQTLYSPPFQTSKLTEAIVQEVVESLREELSTQQGVKQFVDRLGIDTQDIDIKKIDLLYANRPVNKGQAPSILRNRNTSLGRETRETAQFLNARVEQLLAANPNDPNLVLANAALERYNELCETFNSSLSTIANFSLNPKTNPTAELAALEQIIMNKIGGERAGTCYSGKDREEEITCHAIAQMQFYMKHGVFPPKHSSEEPEASIRREYHELVAHQYLSGHGMALANENAIGSHGLKSVKDVFGQEICNVIRDVAKDQYGIDPKVFDPVHDGQQIAKLNKPKAPIKKVSYFAKFKGFIRRKLGIAQPTVAREAITNSTEFEIEIMNAKSFEQLKDVMERYKGPFETYDGQDISELKELMMERMNLIANNDTLLLQAVDEQHGPIQSVTRNYGLQAKFFQLAHAKVQEIRLTQPQVEQDLAKAISHARSMSDLTTALSNYSGPMHYSNGTVMPNEAREQMIEHLRMLTNTPAWILDVTKDEPAGEFFLKSATRNYGIRDKFLEIVQKDAAVLRQQNSSIPDTASPSDVASVSEALSDIDLLLEQKAELDKQLANHKLAFDNLGSLSEDATPAERQLEVEWHEKNNSLMKQQSAVSKLIEEKQRNIALSSDSPDNSNGSNKPTVRKATGKGFKGVLSRHQNTASPEPNPNMQPPRTSRPRRNSHAITSGFQAETQESFSRDNQRKRALSEPPKVDSKKKNKPT